MKFAEIKKNYVAKAFQYFKMSTFLMVKICAKISLNNQIHTNSFNILLEEMQGHRIPKQITLFGRLDLSGLVERKEGCKF